MWEFGGGVDPASATEPAPVLDAVAAGSYEGDLTVANPAGQDTFHFSYSVLPAGDPPVIESVSPTSGDAGTQVIVSAIVAGTPPFTYSWDFDGAGTPDDPTAESPSVALVNTAGIYSCTLEVTNTCGSDTMDFGFEVLTSFKGVMVVVDSGGAQDPPDDVGSYCRLIAADGRPAIGYRNSTRSRLQYVRANDAYGTTWPAAKKIVVSSHDAGSWMSMALVGGRPAIAYYNDTDDDLMFIAAEDAAGDAWWAAPVTVDSDRTTGRHTCLTVVAGRPAITYYSDTISSLKYVRAANPSGTAWNSPLVLDEGSCGVFNSLTIVNGNPAVSYRHYGADELRYLRAADEGGVVWPDTPTVVESSHDPWYTCLLVLGETPAVIYQNDPDGHLMFVRAKDANGDSWGQPLTLDDGGASGADTGQYVSGCLVQGLPAAAYLAGSPDGDLMYVVAKDQLGNSWNLPVRVDTGGGNWVGQYASLAVISGHPAIAYYDMTAGVLKYVIANDAYGLDWPEEV